MTPEQIARVRSTWALALAAGDDLAVGFYDRLFEVAPQLMPLFGHVNMAAMSDKLSRTLEIFVRSLDDLPALADDLRGLGRRHEGYGVEPAHYALVGDALVWTIAKAVGPSFTERDRAAWTVAYVVLADAMQQGSVEATPALS